MDMTDDPVIERVRSLFKGVLIQNGGFDGATADACIAADKADALAKALQSRLDERRKISARVSPCTCNSRSNNPKAWASAQASNCRPTSRASARRLANSASRSPETW
jgi:hypothetical protein